MRVLSVQQPWARCIAAGVKPVENRTWTTTYRGLVIVHASTRPDLAGDTDPLVVAAFGPDAPVGAPTGVAVAVVELVGVCAASTAGRPCGCGPWARPGLYHWQVTNPLPLQQPIRYRGSLGLRPAPDDLVAAVRAQAWAADRYPGRPEHGRRVT